VSGPLKAGILAVRVTPKASRNEITGLYTGADGAMSLRVKVTVAPDKGKANAAVIEVLANNLRLSRSTITLVKGDTDRNKTFQISGPTETLEALIASFKDTGKTHGEDH
jgi:uncharacterized protein